MQFLIDGHNLIAKIPDISLEDPDDEAKLVIRLRRWSAAGSNRKISLFFDGGLPGGREAYLSSPSVNVIFATAGRTADDLMINRIMSVQNPAECTVVSSDLEVKRVAVMNKIKTISSGDFASQLNQAISLKFGVRNDSDATEDANRESILNDQEIAEWLEIFAEDDHSQEEI
jgi:predicted RNA-binding protein with PIN domain